MKTAIRSPRRHGAPRGARLSVSLLALVVLCLLLGACGNKGSLVRPAAATATAAPEGLESDGDPTEGGPPAEILPPPAEEPPAADAEGDG